MSEIDLDKSIRNAMDISIKDFEKFGLQIINVREVWIYAGNLVGQDYVKINNVKDYWNLFSVSSNLEDPQEDM